MVIIDDSLPEMVKNYLTKIKDNLKHVETSKKRSPNSEYNQLHVIKKKKLKKTVSEEYALKGGNFS